MNFHLHYRHLTQFMIQQSLLQYSSYFFSYCLQLQVSIEEEKVIYPHYCFDDLKKLMRNDPFAQGSWNLLRNHHLCSFAHGSRERHYLKDDFDKTSQQVIKVPFRIKRQLDLSNLLSLVIPLQEKFTDGIKDQGKCFYH